MRDFDALGAAVKSGRLAVEAGLFVEHWIDDGLMATFFFLVGLETKRVCHYGIGLLLLESRRRLRLWRRPFRAFDLNRWARQRSIRAIDAAIAGTGLKPGSAAFAPVDDPAGVGRHRLVFREPASGTGNHRLGKDDAHRCALPCVIALPAIIVVGLLQPAPQKQESTNRQPNPDRDDDRRRNPVEWHWLSIPKRVARRFLRFCPDLRGH